MDLLATSHLPSQKGQLCMARGSWDFFPRTKSSHDYYPNTNDAQFLGTLYYWIRRFRQRYWSNFKSTRETYHIHEPSLRNYQTILVSVCERNVSYHPCNLDVETIFVGSKVLHLNRLVQPQKLVRATNNNTRASKMGDDIVVIWLWDHL